MEMDQRMKFVCKHCNKRYPCGKSLGGHLSSHKTLGSLVEDHGENCGANSMEGFEVADGRLSYSLRKNRKKSRLLGDSISKMQLGNVCKECGKGFQSLKALCGHMACHSEREKANNRRKEELDCSEKRILEISGMSDSETSAPVRCRRSKRIRYRIPAKNLVSGSSSISEIELEKEEVAKCLMMLSRDTSNFKGVWNRIPEWAQVSDSSEAKSSSGDVRSRKLIEIDVTNTSGSGYVRLQNGVKRLESDCSTDNNPRICELQNPKLVCGSKTREDVELGKWLNGFKSKAEVVGSTVRKELDASRKRVEHSSRSPKYVHKSFSNIRNGPLICQQIFDSPKQLVEHDNYYKKLKVSSRSRHESSKMGEDVKMSHNNRQMFTDFNLCGGKLPIEKEKKPGTKKSSRHECPICFRVFRSGQALGGHKRSHFLGVSEGKLVADQEITEAPALIDLNLPAWGNENGNAGFVTW